MTLRMFGKGTALALVLISTGCDILSVGSNDGEIRSEPTDTTAQLLRMHGVEGRSLNDRPEVFQKAPVNRAALGRIFIDYSVEDPFLADLYVGFIVGVLAENQHTLQVTTKEKRAEIRAGKARIYLHLQNGIWRISLAESIPDAIKARAKMEKLRVASNRM